MATKEQIKIARELLEKKWGSEGECRSCGWRAGLYEHEVSNEDLEEAIDNDWILKLCCLSDDDDAEAHRGAMVYLRQGVADGI